jgi:hypothetical protein
VVLGEHPLVAAELIAVARRTTENLTPPGDHMQAVLLPHPAREHRREQLVGFDAVIERVDQPRKCGFASGPVKKRKTSQPS